MTTAVNEKTTGIAGSQAKRQGLATGSRQGRKGKVKNYVGAFVALVIFLSILNVWRNYALQPPEPPKAASAPSTVPPQEMPKGLSLPTFVVTQDPVIKTIPGGYCPFITAGKPGVHDTDIRANVLGGVGWIDFYQYLELRNKGEIQLWQAPSQFEFRAVSKPVTVTIELFKYPHPRCFVPKKMGGAPATNMSHSADAMSAQFFIHSKNHRFDGGFLHESLECSASARGFHVAT